MQCTSSATSSLRESASGSTSPRHLTGSGRLSGIFLIISGSVLYVYSKSSPAAPQAASARGKGVGEKDRSATEPFLADRKLADLEKGSR